MKNLEVIRMQSILFLIGVLYPYYSFSVYLVTDVHFHWFTTFPVSMAALVLFFHSLRAGKLPRYYAEFILLSALSAYPQYVQLMLENPEVGELILVAHMTPAPWFIAQASFRHALYYALGTIAISLAYYIAWDSAPVHLFSHINSMLTIYGVLGLVLYIYGRYQQEIAVLKHHLLQQNTQLANQADELTEVSETLNLQCLQQASAIEESSVSLEKMRSSVQINQQKLRKSVAIAQSFNQLMSLAHSSKDEILQEFHDLEAEIQSMDHTIAGNISAIQQLTDDLKKIDKATEVVQSIVSQTQILSFNAAIEASQAQSYGKGFVVIAKQIKALSLKSGEAASHIDSILKSHQDRLNDILSAAIEELSAAMAKMQKELHKVRQKVDDYSRIFTDVQKSSQEIVQNTDESMRSTEELSSGFDQIDKAGSSLRQCSYTINRSAEKTRDQIDILKVRIQESQHRIAAIERLVIDQTDKNTHRLFNAS